MEVHVKESTIVRPVQETPNHYLQLSVLDLVSRPAHVPLIYFYQRPNQDFANFFEFGLLKEALSKVLVQFYPIAGRFERDENGRIQINCNGEGVLFIEAETRWDIEDLKADDFTQNFLRDLFPMVDYTKDVSSYPIFMAQVTRFKCGGVSLGVGVHHTFGDGDSIFPFTNAWAAMTRGLPISIPLFYDRTILGVGVPTSPTFHHIEYDPPPSMNPPSRDIEFQSNPSSISTAILKLSVDQMKTLKKTILQRDLESGIIYSKFEILAAHIWRCLCIARGLSDDQVSKLHISTNGRARLKPPLPTGYIGNVVFVAASIATSGDIQSKPLKYTVERIHKALKRMDDEYLKSTLAYINQQPDPTVLRKGGHMFKSPNLNISNVSNWPFYDVNFGWGRPIFFRPVALLDGVLHILPSPTNDGSLYVAVNLETRHLQLFKKLFYEIFIVSGKIARSRY